jgi:hypothetical protein
LNCRRGADKVERRALYSTGVRTLGGSSPKARPIKADLERCNAELHGNGDGPHD